MAENETESAFAGEHEARLDAEAEAEIETGQGVPHQVVRQWLNRLGRGEKLPPPTYP